MNEMKWETIKRNAIREFDHKVAGADRGLIGLGDSTPFLALVAQIEHYNSTGNLRPATTILEEWQEYGRLIIEHWDVRMVGRLIECFPSCVPAHWKGRKLTAYVADNENCDWMVALCDPRA